MAKFAMVAYKCKSYPEWVPNRWTVSHYAACPRSVVLSSRQAVPTEATSWSLDLLSGVHIEALLWGFGTAIGELPPYLVARAARLAGNTEEEVKEVEELEAVTFIDKMKKLIYSSLQKRAFITVLLCASIPTRCSTSQASCAATS
jgi:hypothetical protein